MKLVNSFTFRPLDLVIQKQGSTIVFAASGARADILFLKLYACKCLSHAAKGNISCAVARATIATYLCTLIVKGLVSAPKCP